MSVRTRARVSPRQSPRPAILASICSAAEAPLVSGVSFFMARSCDRSHLLAGQAAGLLHPVGELRFIEVVARADVEIAHVLLFGRHRRLRVERRALEEGDL